MSDKAIKISIGVDDAAFSRAKRQVAELVQEVARLTEATSKSALFGGGGMRVGNAPIIAGGGSAGTQTTHAAARSTGNGGTDAMTRAVSSAAVAMKSSAQVGVGAFKELDKAFSDFVFSADGRVRKLLSTVGSISQAFSGLGRSMGGRAAAGGSSDFFASSRGSMMRTAGMPPSFHTNDWSPFWNGGAPASAGESLGPGMGSRMLGMAGRVGGAAIGSAVGLGALGLLGVQHAQQYQNASLQYGLEQPLWQGSNKAAFGQMYGGAALAMKNGDVALAVSQQRAARSAEGKYVTSGKYLQDSKTLLENKTPTTFWESWKAGSTWEWMKSDMNRATGRIANGFNSITGRPTDPNAGGWNDLGKSPLEMQRERAEAQLPLQAARAFEQQVQEQRMRDPVYMARVNEVYGGALGSMSLARAAGISGGVYERTGAGGQKYKIDSLSALTARANRSGYDVSEYAGMIGQMGQTAGRGLMHAATGSMLSMTHGGLSNAAQLYGLGAQFNGGGASGASRFMGGLQGSIGAGGLDVTAASSVFGAGSALMTSGNFTGGGGGFMSTIAAAAYSGSTGGDMMGARQVTAGLGGMQATLGGTIDPLQRGINAAAALQAAGNLPPGVKDALLSIDPATLLDALSSGDVPPSLMARFPRGTDPKQALAVIRNYNMNVNRMSLARYSDKMGAGTTMGDSVAKFRGAGGLGYLSGIKGRKNRIAELGNLTEAIVMTTGKSRDSVMGELRIQAQSQGLLGRVTGRGAHQTASSTSMYGVGAGVQGEIAETEGKERADQEAGLKDDIRSVPGAIKESRRQQRSAMGNANNTDAVAAAEGVAQSLQLFVAALKNMVGGAQKAGPPRSSVR